MAVRKTTRKTTGTRKTATAKAPTAKKTSRKKAPGAKRALGKKAATRKAVKKKGVSSAAVNLGNVFGLRPRVNTSFRPEDFHGARRILEEESYATLEEAARAVAKRAVELSNDPSNRRGPKHRR